jgi:hypothetical protein
MWEDRIKFEAGGIEEFRLECNDYSEWFWEDDKKTLALRKALSQELNAVTILWGEEDGKEGVMIKGFYPATHEVKK